MDRILFSTLCNSNIGSVLWILVKFYKLLEKNKEENRDIDSLIADQKQLVYSIRDLNCLVTVVENE